MILKSRHALFFVIFTLFFFPNLRAQEINESQSLTIIFQNIQDRFNYQFNYAEDIVEGIIIKPPNSNLSFKKVLDYLEKETGLSFVLMNDNLVLVKEKVGLILCGYIKNKNDLLPLSSATIQGLNHSTTSDQNGFFRLQVNNALERITIRFLGFKTIEAQFQSFDNQLCSDVFLEQDDIVLSEVLLSQYLANGINKINNGSFEIDFSKFEILPGLIDNDVLQSIQALPGVQSINETVSNINIRGGTHDQNLILWDGIKMYQSGHFFGLISMYNPQITEKANLAKNGSGVALTDGVSGTISMHTDKQVNSELKGNIGINFIDVNGFIDVPLGKNSSLQIAARKSISDFIETPTYSNFFDRISQDTEVENNQNSTLNSDKAFDFYDTSLRWIYKISDHDELRINFINVANELVFDENATIDGNNESRQSSLTQNSIAGALYYKRHWNDRLNTTLDVYETDYKLKSINVNILDSQRFLQENVVSETSAKLKANYKLNDRFMLLNGYHFVETKITNLDDVDDPVFKLKVSEVIRTHGVFSQLSYNSPNNRTYLNAGLRFNYIVKFKKQIWEPRLSLTHRFFNHLTLEVLGEYKHQNTSQIINFQNDFLGIEKRRWQLSNNSDIPIIRSKQFSVGLNYDNNGWLLGLEAYYKKVDGITTQSQGFQNQYEFLREKGSYEVSGFDFLLKKQIKKFSSWFSYSIMNNNYEFKTIPENSFPSNYEISHAIALGIVYSTGKLKVSTGLNWHSGNPTTRPIENNEIVDNTINYESTNGSQLKDYMRLDLSARYDFKFGKQLKGDIGASIWNVLGRKNEINSYYNLNEGSLSESIQSSLGFTPNVALRIYF